MRTFTFAFLTALAVSAIGANAFANPRPLPFTYQYETLAEGEAEIEQYADATPLRALSVTNGEPRRYLATEFQTEFEYGITNRLELGLYVSFVPQPSESLASLPTMMWGNGLKQRLRYRFAEAGEWPIDVAVYGELTENERELEIEAKVILQRRFGNLRAMANLWAEREFYFDGHSDWVLNPTAGITYEVLPSFHPGFEYWLRAEYPDDSPPVRPFNLGPHHYVGPAILANFGRIWWSTGAYVHVNDFARSSQVGDSFGNLWVRTIIGVSL